jgi:hypothetical protein
MTQKEHDELEKFTIHQMQKRFRWSSLKSKKEPLDFFYDAYVKNPENIHKAIFVEISNHYYTLVGELQRSNPRNERFEKKCCNCKQMLDSSFFKIRYNKINNFHHPNSYCRKCDSELNKKYIQNNEEYRLKVYKRNSLWAKNNKEKVSETKQIWYQKNKIKIHLRQKENKEKCIAFFNSLKTDEISLLFEKYKVPKINMRYKLKIYINELRKGNI